MIINGKDTPIKDMSLSQLETIQYAFDSYQFSDMGTEKFEPTFKKDPKQFKKLIGSMISYKKDLMGVFREQYTNIDSLLKTHLFHFDDEDYVWGDEWNQYDDELTKVIEKNNNNAFDLGVFSLGVTLGTGYDYGSFSQAEKIYKNARKSAVQINDVTKKRAIAQMKISLDLGESKELFEKRIATVFNYPYRGSFIAQYETMNSYMQGKNGLALDQDLLYKTALSSQASDDICGNINGETTDINTPFSNGFLMPLYHYGCKCDVYYSRTSDGS